MTSSETSTDAGPARAEPGFQPWHFFILLSMLGATAAVWRSRDTQPAALILLSAAVLAAGLVGLALYYALAGFFGDKRETGIVSTRDRDELLREKALVLRSIKELEFDRGMGKVSEADFAEVGGHLRARAMELMEAIDRADTPAAARTPTRPRPGGRTCAACGTANDADAKFCKQCGAKI